MSSKSGLKRSEVGAKNAQLLDDWNAVRLAVLNKEKGMSQAEFDRLEPRLFASWVIEKMARSECLLSGIGRDLEQLIEDINNLRKALPAPPRKGKK